MARSCLPTGSYWRAAVRPLQLACRSSRRYACRGQPQHPRQAASASSRKLRVAQRRRRQQQQHRRALSKSMCPLMQRSSFWSLHTTLVPSAVSDWPTCQAPCSGLCCTWPTASSSQRWQLQWPRQRLWRPESRALMACARALEAAHTLPVPPLREQAERALSVPAAASDNAWMACLCGIVACSPGPAQLLEMLEWAAAQGHHNLLRLCIAELARALGPERQQVRANNDYQEMSLRLRPRKNYWIPSRPKWSRQQAVALLRSLDFTLLGADGLVQLLDIMTAAGMHRTGKLWNEPAAVVAWQRIGDHAAAAAERATADGDKDECSLAERACTSDSESTDGE